MAEAVPSILAETLPILAPPAAASPTVAPPAVKWQKKHKKWLFAVGIAAVIVVIFGMSYRSKKLLRRKLEEQGWVLYTKDGCKHCNQQKRILGKYAMTVSCSGDGKLNGASPDIDCKAITGFPSWYKKRSATTHFLVKGVRTKAQLEKMLMDDVSD